MSKKDTDADDGRPRCGARTRTGTRCRKLALDGSTRCRHHSFRVPGRPRKVTPELVEELLDLILEGNHVTTSAQAVGIGRTTYYRWLRRAEELEAIAYEKLDDGNEDVYSVTDPDDWAVLDFRHTIKTAEAYSEAELVRRIHRMADQGASSWTAYMTILERRFPTRWGRRQSIDARFTDGGTEPAAPTSKVKVPDDAERAQILRRLIATGELERLEAAADAAA